MAHIIWGKWGAVKSPSPNADVLENRDAQLINQMYSQIGK